MTIDRIILREIAYRVHNTAQYNSDRLFNPYFNVDVVPLVTAVARPAVRILWLKFSLSKITK